MPVYDFTQTTIIPLINGVNGTICRDPSFFKTVVFFDDAIKLGVVCFILGIVFMVIINEIDKRWK